MKILAYDIFKKWTDFGYMSNNIKIMDMKTCFIPKMDIYLQRVQKY
jgi:hypothetical protein